MIRVNRLNGPRKVGCCAGSRQRRHKANNRQGRLTAKTLQKQEQIRMLVLDVTGQDRRTDADPNRPDGFAMSSPNDVEGACAG